MRALAPEGKPIQYCHKRPSNRGIALLKAPRSRFHRCRQTWIRIRARLQPCRQSRVLKGRDFSRAVKRKKKAGFSPPQPLTPAVILRQRSSSQKRGTPNEGPMQFLAWVPNYP
jgi:hypothetical protein